MSDWRWQMRNRVRTPENLYQRLPGLQGLGKICEVIHKFPMAISPYYLSLVQEPDTSDPIFRQCVPDIQELFSSPCCVPDPLREHAHSPVPQLVHRYPDRALAVVSSTCAMYCRHCTRKRMAGIRERFVAPALITRHVRYLHQHPEITDVIVSGGDPLTMSTERLETILQSYRSVPSVEVIRIGSRTPVTLPMRITDKLCAMLERYHPLWLCTHFNHPREVTAASAAACDKLLRAGVPVLNQTVLLKGVNDRVNTMVELVKALIAIRVKPYYLFQCDLVQGVEHFRTPTNKGVEIVQALRGNVSGIAIPQFVVDAPNGGGKIPLNPNYVLSSTLKETSLCSCEGKVVDYPEPVYTNND